MTRDGVRRVAFSWVGIILEPEGPMPPKFLVMEYFWSLDQGRPARLKYT
jgi:hypothetical protein